MRGYDNDMVFEQNENVNKHHNGAQFGQTQNLHEN